MKLTEIMAVWEILHVKDVGDLGYCDLQDAIEKVCAAQDDVDADAPIHSLLKEVIIASGCRSKNNTAADLTEYMPKAAQYHTDKAKLWSALPPIFRETDDVFTLIVNRIKSLDAVATAAREHWLKSSHEEDCPCIGSDLSDTRCLCGLDELEMALLSAGFVSRQEIREKGGEQI